MANDEDGVAGLDANANNGAIRRGGPAAQCSGRPDGAADAHGGEPYGVAADGNEEIGRRRGGRAWQWPGREDWAARLAVNRTASRWTARTTGRRGRPCGAADARRTGQSSGPGSDTDDEDRRRRA